MKRGTKESVSDNQMQRLQVLRKYNVLDTPAEQAYDDILSLAAFVCDVPIALISLIDDDRQWFKANVGLNTVQMLHDASSFCSYAISNPEEIFIVHDARADARFSNTSWVKFEPHVRFYAGAPLMTRERRALGALCVIDRSPRQLTAAQADALRALSRQAVAQVEINHQLTALQETELRFRAFMDNSPVLASLKDEQGRYVYVNQPFLQRSNLHLSDILGKDDFQLWPEDIARRLRERDLHVMAEGSCVNEIETGCLSNGQITYWQVSKFLLHGQHRLVGSMGLDITQAKLYEQKLMQYQEELKKTLARLEILSVTDGLTGLFNRRAFEEKLEYEFERARRYNLPLSLLLLDVDNFKYFNDTLGHTAGDGLLQSVAGILKDNARANDVSARFGGDEFAVILPNTDSKVAFHFAERLRSAAKKLQCDPRQATISIGVSALNPAMVNRSALVIAADNALYDAKRKGRNQVSNIA